MAVYHELKQSANRWQDLSGSLSLGLGGGGDWSADPSISNRPFTQITFSF